MSRIIEVVPHDPAWADAYQTEVHKLAAVFAADQAEFHHIGSTAIPGILAKPVIDIMVVVAKLERVEEWIPGMTVMGYEHRGEAGIPGRQFFRKDTDGVRSHHVHIYEAKHPDIATQLNFRDYLRAHPAEAQAYSQLKQKLAVRFRESPPEYTDAKTDFITNINQLAVDWRTAQK